MKSKTTTFYIKVQEPKRKNISRLRRRKKKVLIYMHENGGILGKTGVAVPLMLPLAVQKTVPWILIRPRRLPIIFPS